MNAGFEDYVQRLQNAVRKLDQRVQRLEELRKQERASKFDAQRALSEAWSCVDVAEYWTGRAITAIEGALDGD